MYGDCGCRKCSDLHRAAVGVVLLRMERTPLNLDDTIDEARQTLLEMVITELDLGLTFLDVASTTTDVRHAHKSVGNAIVALRAADRFVSELAPDTRNLEAIKQRREMLAERLREFGTERPRGTQAGDSHRSSG